MTPVHPVCGGFLKDIFSDGLRGLGGVTSVIISAGPKPWAIFSQWGMRMSGSTVSRKRTSSLSEGKEDNIMILAHFQKPSYNHK